MDRIPKPPAHGLVDAIAKAIDAWHETHPGLSIGEVIRAFHVIEATLAEAAGDKR